MREARGSVLSFMSTVTDSLGPSSLWGEGKGEGRAWHGEAPYVAPGRPARAAAACFQASPGTGRRDGTHR